MKKCKHKDWTFVSCLVVKDKIKAVRVCKKCGILAYSNVPSFKKLREKELMNQISQNS